MDKNFWTSTYKKGAIIRTPSSFAVFCNETFLTDSDLIFDIGCGNGRDSFFFMSQGLEVIGLDQCLSISSDELDETISAIHSIAKESNGGKEAVVTQQRIGTFSFMQGDFTQCILQKSQSRRVIYSRFTWHSINDEQEASLLDNLSSNLIENDLVLIEARTTNDPLYGQGEKVGEHSFFTDHFRRFICVDKLKQKVESLGFDIISLSESDGLSKYNGEDPVLMRMALKKK